MYSLFATIAILPLTFKEYVACIIWTIISTSASALIPHMNGMNHSGFVPLRRWSANRFENPGVIIPMRDDITVVMTTRAKAEPEPLSLFFAKLHTLLGLPSGLKSSPGSIMRQIPVNDLSKVSILTE